VARPIQGGFEPAGAPIDRGAPQRTNG